VRVFSSDHVKTLINSRRSLWERGILDSWEIASFRINLKFRGHYHLTHCGRVTQICVFTLQLCKTEEQICVFNRRLVSTHYTLNYVIHGAFLRMVLLTDVYRN